MNPTRSRTLAAVAMLAFVLSFLGVLAFHPRTDSIDAYAEGPSTTLIRAQATTSSAPASTTTTHVDPPSTVTTRPPAPPTTVKPFVPKTTLPPTTTTTTTRPPSTTTTTAKPLPKPAPAPSVVAAFPTTTRPPVTAPPPTTPPNNSDAAFLACVKQRESGGNYQAVGRGYYGAYQFAPSTWDGTARHAGRLDLVGVRPDRASPADQDAMALHLLQWQGRGPWGGRCP